MVLNKKEKIMDQQRKRKIFLNQLNQDLEIEFNLNSSPFNADQIEEIARLNPVKVADLEAIKGFGPENIKKYGEILIERLAAFNQESLPLDESDQIKNTLKELQKRLINISKRNRLLYVGKTSPKTTYDLVDLKNEGLQEILFNGAKVKLIDVEQDNAKTKYNSLNDIYKNVNRAYKETGNFDLYIATPFVSGEFLGDPFTVRAPLTLFPIKLEINNKAIYVMADEDKDVLINTNLIVAAQNFLKTNQPLIPMNLEEVNPETFKQDLLQAYKLQGLQINDVDSELIPFEAKTIDSFKENKPGVFVVEPVALLGYFPILSTSIQRDYAKINQMTSYPKHVLTLLETLSESVAQEQQPQLNDVQFNEEHLAYINPLNTSQEQAQLQIKKGQHIVIQGPPGTGKSQTISNVIAQSIYDKKNVLMVSEKKAAIDVVYSRLSHLNQYALILDNINDKQNFYRQCEKLFASQPHAESTESITAQNKAMNELQADLAEIKTLLTTPLKNGQTPIELYGSILKIDYHQPEVLQEYQFLKENVPQSLLDKPSISLDTSLDFEQLFKQYQLQKEIPFVKQINTSLSDYDILIMKQQIETDLQKCKEFEQSGFLNKLLNKKSLQTLLEPYQKLYPKLDSESLKLVPLILEQYPLICQPLNGDLDESLLTTIQTLKTHFNESIETTLKRLNNFIGFEILQQFENEHRQIHDLIASYPQIVDSFNASAKEKSEILLKILGDLLSKKRFELNVSKRALEMQRIIERKRKWSISKFVDKFYVELFDGIQIWLCTPDVVSEIFPLKADLFDVLIFDEASQLYIEKAIPSILRSKQVVIAGDSEQLRPSAFGVGRYNYDEDLEDDFIDSTAALDEESLLDLARFKFPSTILNYHYRSLYEELIAYSNAAFYKNQLIVSPNALKKTFPPIKRIKVENGQWQKRMNQAESTAVVNLIKELLSSRQHQETIGVITFNATQRKLIEADLEKAAIEDKAFGDLYYAELNRSQDNQDLSLFVKNIENVQGDERDIIIFSITYAPDEAGKVPTFFGWLSQQGGQNRLNVAITRAKRQIYVITSIEPHQLSVNTEAMGPKLLQKYLEYSKAISDNDEQAVQLVLNELSAIPLEATQDKAIHPLAQKVSCYLEQQGYQTKHHYGIGQFTVELAIFKDDTLIHGFEFDHQVYAELLDQDRARDIHQPNYLKARGWHLTRLFSYDFYHHPTEFFDHISTILKAE